MVERGLLAPLTQSIEAQGASESWPTDLPSVIGLNPAIIVGIALPLLGFTVWRLRGSTSQSRLWSRRLNGIALGVLGVLAWVTGARAGWQWGLSATGPSRSLVDIFLLGGTSVPLWGTLMIAGVPLGSWFSARVTGPVAWRAPAAVEVPRRVCGGLLMGAGGTLAGGCNIGHALTGLSIFAVQSVLATAAMGAGAWCASWLAQAWPRSSRE
jgi:hypothetical protein